MKRTKLIFLIAGLILTKLSFAQVDSLVFYNGNYDIGEVKYMERGVLTFKTEYSDSDFKIEWDGIKEIYTVSYLLITLSDGSRYNGYINTLPDGNVEITIEGGETRTVKHDDIVWLDDIDVGFWSKLYASIDVGFDIAKSNNLRQISTRASLGYLAEQWNFDVSYNTLFSKQDNIENIERTDGSINYKYFLPKSWYPYISINFLSNTEQSIDLRSSGSIGFGKYIIHTNRSYWGVNLGANFNNERFTIDTIPNRDSWEGSIGTELNLFDIGVLDLFTKVNAYPGITESGRFRTDFNFDAKYEMPFDDDFYIKFGITLNYDNQPAEVGKEIDYVIHTGFGWEL
jgi:hypothetical protein